MNSNILHKGKDMSECTSQQLIIMSHNALFSAMFSHYTVLQMKNIMKSNIPVIVENTDDFIIL